MNVNALRSADVRSPFSVVAPAVVLRVGVGGVDSFRLQGAKRKTENGAESLAKRFDPMGECDWTCSCEGL